MEESSEAHMETDVSSTTEDVPETQEVTGSHGNVEMVIVVEKVKEEDMNSNAQIQKQPPQVENVISVSTASEKSPQKDEKLQKAVLKSSNKDGEGSNSIQHSPKPELLQKTASKMSELIVSVQPPTQVQLSEPVDSSSKIDISALPNREKEKHYEKKSPVKEVDVEKTALRSPIKENEMNDPTKAKEPAVPDKSNMNGRILDIDLCKQENEINKTITTTPINLEQEALNDSQVETNVDISEKEHNKSISRELKSLINSAKESKIISECTQLTSKTRKSRTPLDSSNTSLNTSVEADKIKSNRRSSNNSQKSNCSEKSDKNALKRSMRSQNPEFVSKIKQFLNSVTSKVLKDSDEAMSDDEIVEARSKERSDFTVSTPKKKKVLEEKDLQVVEKSNKLRSDSYCWRCHWEVEQATNEKMHSPMQCTVCPRSFHFKCLSGTERSKISSEKSWVCPDCMLVLHAESSDTRSTAMKKISLGMLCELLKYALERMMELNGVEPFMQPVDRIAFPDYDKYVVHPMDLSLMKENIAEGLYGSTEAFQADVQWILHNSIIFNTCEQTFMQSKLTSGARALMRSCRLEMGEIEACPECYSAAHARRPTWFTDVCSTPHILLWAKLKGFPYWPAKGMSVNSAGLVDVRFFGAHDRAWVPPKDCFLFSEKDPNNFRTKRQDILDSMQEAEQHIRNISRKYGKFVYPPFKTQFDPAKLNEQLKMMIPSFEGEVGTPQIKDKSSIVSPTVDKEKRRSNSKSSKSSLNDGDISELEETSTVTSRKMADGAEIAREEDEYSPDKDKTMEVDVSQSKDNDISRKRRRSGLEEAVLTIIESSSTAEKRKRVEKNERTNTENIESQEPSSSKELQEKPQVKLDKSMEIGLGESTPKGKAVNSKQNDVPPKIKDDEPSSSTVDRVENENLRVTPIRLVAIPGPNKQAPKTFVAKNGPSKTSTPKSTLILPNKQTPKQKQGKTDKSLANESKDLEKFKAQKRRNSRNRSLNNSTGSTKTTEKKNEKTEILNNKDVKTKENDTGNKNKDVTDKSANEKHVLPKPSSTDSPKSAKDRLQFDDDTSLAVIARVTKNGVSTTANSLPTISSVRSLSTTAANTSTTSTKTKSLPKTIEVTIEANSHSSIFIPNNVESVRNMKEAVTKLKKLRSDTDPPVGRVGVRAFARMTSPEKKTNDDVQVEIKAEPIDLEEIDAERQMEKLDLMNACRLRPVNPPQPNLREVRINKVLVTSLSGRKAAAKPVESRPKAKKTFPQPKKPDDGRSELNSKNSMVYIPIQPPTTQAPVRLTRPVTSSGPVVTPPGPRPTAPVNTTANNTVNTVTTPLISMPINSSASSSPAAPGTSGPSGPSGLSGPAAPASTSAPIANVPTVHTVPLMTSVNGQWMFSLQPVMSVGAVDNGSSSSMVNGHPERSPATALAPPAAPAPQLGSSPAAPLPNRTANDTGAPGEPPRLLQRPALLNPLDASTPIGSLPPPSTAGPLTAKLNQNAVKLTDFFRTLLEDSLEKLDEPTSHAATLRLQLEQARWRHQQEINEIKHNHELTLSEVRASFDREKMRAVSEARRAAQVELEAAVKQAKAKQWCASCTQEAQFYCCWNTSYCDYPCQRAHWSQHFSVCTQQRSQDGNNGNDGSNSPDSRLQPQPDLPKNMAAPALTVGGKLAPSRVYTQDQNNGQKTSIIVSMVEDTSGNQTMRCVGTYKSPVTTQMSPLIINNQLLNNEDSNSNKKVVTSGGYLIVGAGASSASVMTPAPTRRTHTVQYFT